MFNRNVAVLDEESLIFFAKTKLIWHPFIKTWCEKPYPNHPDGCPNFNKKIGCPMDNPCIDEIIQVDKPVYIIGVGFDLQSHKEKMKEKYPHWTEKQCSNVLYWQPKIKRKLFSLLKEFKEDFPTYKIDTLPEGHGVNITRMLLNERIPFTWDYPLKYVWKVAIAGLPIKKDD